MNIIELIETKRDGGAWSSHAIKKLVEFICDDSTPDYQISALLMAIYLNGLTSQETADLTFYMARSGDRVELAADFGPVLDKHSTGGVGDKTSLVLMPMVAATGIRTTKLSGRGLGHTGGTLDKLSVFSGFRTNLSTFEIKKFVQNPGIVISGQTTDLVPADKRLYALRDATATVNSIPLIASSIMSKKVASGAGAVLLDVKVGNGGMFESIGQARELAQKMISIGDTLGIKTNAVLTSMSTPLGNAIGNALEVQEAISTLQGEGSPSLRALCLELGARMLIQSNYYHSLPEAIGTLEKVLASGKALNTFEKMIKNQGGDPSLVRNAQKIPLAPIQHQVYAERSGYIAGLHAKKIGLASMFAGAGRITKDQEIDLGAGILLNKVLGEPLVKGELILTLFTSHEPLAEKALIQLEDAILISTDKPKPAPMILEEF